MALFCSSCRPPILCPKFQRIYAIQRHLAFKISISATSDSEICKLSISAPAKLLCKKVKCGPNLSSPAELEEGRPFSVTVFIKGLAQSTAEGVLKREFSRFGEVSRVKVISHKKTKQSLGFAYVWFTKEEHAQAAVDEMNGQFFEGRFIHVALAKTGSCKTRPRPTPYKF